MYYIKYFRFCIKSTPISLVIKEVQNLSDVVACAGGKISSLLSSEAEWTSAPNESAV
jgi:hypothetical protein